VLVGQCPVLQGPIVKLQIPDPQAVAAGLVHIGGPYPLEGGTDLGLSLGGLRCGIQQPVCRQYKMGLSGYQQFGQGVYLEFFQVLEFPFKDYGIDDHPIAHNVDGPFVEYSGRNGVQYVLNTVELQGMARIGTSLKSGNDIV